ncbi:VanW family protein [Gordonia sp. PDNC005]|uniref:VanW family protein n=1 Tax=unclassified Gordonia (in: high G+C Gram-positive bacteria) TaxID=2657482 RepID=UPI00196621B5|nr:VanW family protein [Gordonia sp. PDNC005]QRY64815.1 VanW family protein [Gordonia sp. PDNC005]
MKRRVGAWGWVARGLLAAIMLTALVFAFDYALGHGKTARGVQIAEFDLGGKSDDQARAILQQISVVAHGPITVRTDSGSAAIDPAELGAAFDVEGTLARLKEQPANPFTRLAALFGAHRDVAPVVDINRASFDKALDARRSTLEKAAVEGGVHFDGLRPVADYPATGMRIDRDAGVIAVGEHWLEGGPLDLAMEPFSPTVGRATVDATVADVAPQVTASPLRLKGRGRDIVLTPRELGALVTFVADGKGGLVPHVKAADAKKSLSARTDRTESEPVSATFRLVGGSPKVVPSVEGAKVDWDKTAEAIAAAAVADDRSIDVEYTVSKPKLTTSAAKRLGVTEVVSEFTTGGFSGPSGENIRIVADKVDGAVVLPGKTFSLNGYTGPRGAAQGYVESGIIDHGRPSTAVGGGISQFATTLYNAAYFAGLQDVDHTEHAYYISRYPEAREATVFEGLIDLKFKNDTKHGVFIETQWSSSSVTVRLWSTKTRDVESITGDRTLPTSPETVTVPRGDDCIASSGLPGFTASDTRVIRDHRTGREINRHTRTVRYAPEPVVRCR